MINIVMISKYFPVFTTLANHLAVYTNRLKQIFNLDTFLYLFIGAVSLFIMSALIIEGHQPVTVIFSEHPVSEAVYHAVQRSTAV